VSNYSVAIDGAGGQLTLTLCKDREQAETLMTKLARTRGWRGLFNPVTPQQRNAVENASRVRVNDEGGRLVIEQPLQFR
jgi:hypothetical protein